MQYLLIIAVKKTLKSEVAIPLIRLGEFMRSICSKVIEVEDIKKLQRKKDGPRGKARGCNSRMTTNTIIFTCTIMGNSQNKSMLVDQLLLMGTWTSIYSRTQY